MHLADIHLDSPFTINDAEKSAKRREELRETFGRAIEYVKENNIELLLMPGDLVEYEHISSDTAKLLKDAFASIPATKVVISPGNHDFYNDSCVYKKIDFTDNVYIFRKAEISKFSFDEINADIYGFAFNSKFYDRNPLATLEIENPERINILSAHLDLISKSRSCPVTEEELAGTKVDYAALGHIHNGGEIKKTGDVTYAYSGCLEGRDFGECGYKGAIVGTIEKENGKVTVKAEHIRFSKRRYMSVNVNVTGSLTEEMILEKLKESISDFKEDTLLRVIIEGDISPDISIKDIDIRRSFPAPYTLEIKDKTLPLFNYDSLRDDPTIKGAFFRQLLPDLTSDDPHTREVAAAALRYGLDALSNRDII